MSSANAVAEADPRHEAVDRLTKYARMAWAIAGQIADASASLEASRAALLSVTGSLARIEAGVDLRPYVVDEDAATGAYLLGLWGMPDEIVWAVAEHRHPSTGAEDALGPTGAVHTAARLASEALGIAPAAFDRGCLEQAG